MQAFKFSDKRFSVETDKIVQNSLHEFSYIFIKTHDVIYQYDVHHQPVVKIGKISKEIQPSMVNSNTYVDANKYKKSYLMFKDEQT